MQEDKKDTKSDSNDAMIQENEVSSTTPTNESGRQVNRTTPTKSKVASEQNYPNQESGRKWT